MSRRHIICVFVILLCLMQTGCHDDSYQGTLHVNEMSKEVPQPMWFSIGKNPSSGLSVKGTGVVSEVSELENMAFYIYSLNRNPGTSFAHLSQDDGLSCLIDASLDVKGSRLGREARIDRITGYAFWTSGAGPVYYPSGAYSEEVFDCFAYYIDDMQLTDADVHRYDDSIVLDVAIDGSQDLMTSKAELTEDQYESLEDMKISSDERYLAERRSYSYVAARKYGIQPVFTFSHHLVKLDFEFLSGVTPGITKEVTVEKIEVSSRYKGEFTVADKNAPDGIGIRFKEERKNLVLREADGSEFVPFVVRTDSDGSQRGKAVSAPGSLLLAPDKAYELIVTLSEVRSGEYLVNDNTLELVLNAGVFEPGNSYVVSLTLYGLMDINIAAKVGTWEPNGDYVHDQDKRPGT